MKDNSQKTNCTAKWISRGVPSDSSVTEFRKTFRVKRGLKKAVLKVSAVGVYNAYVNGIKVGDAVLAPGWTDYRARVLYALHDVTKLLGDENLLTVGVGDGWAVGTYGGGDKMTKNYSDKTMMYAELTLTYEDGRREVILSDESFDVYDSEVRFADIYNGEHIDKTYIPRLLGKAVVTDFPARLVKEDGVRVVEKEVLCPVEFITTPKGELVVDFGQNMSGYVEITVKGKSGNKSNERRSNYKAAF